MNTRLQDLVSLATETIKSSPAQTWRHHGFGLLSLYLTPVHRLNMWSEKLRRIGPDDGAWHTHRSRIHSTVLAGSVWNTELLMTHRGKLREEWLAVRGEVSGPMGLAYVEPRARTEHGAGCSYETQTRTGHHTEPGSAGAVTSVLVLDDGGSDPVVWVKPGCAPCPAFAERCSDETIDRVRAESLALLTEASQ